MPRCSGAVAEGAANSFTNDRPGAERIGWQLGIAECHPADADRIGSQRHRLDHVGAAHKAAVDDARLEGNAEQVKLTDIGAFVSCDDFGAYFLSNNYIESGQGSVTHFAEDLTVDHISVNDDIAALSIGPRGIALYDISDP